MPERAEWRLSVVMSPVTETTSTREASPASGSALSEGRSCRLAAARESVPETPESVLTDQRRRPVESVVGGKALTRKIWLSETGRLAEELAGVKRARPPEPTCRRTGLPEMPIGPLAAMFWPPTTAMELPWTGTIMPGARVKVVGPIHWMMGRVAGVRRV